jgi:hypothetical protein
MVLRQMKSLMTLLAATWLLGGIALAGQATMDEYRPVLADGLYKQCVAGTYPGLRGADQCGCFADYIANSVTLAEAVAGTHGQFLDSFGQRMGAAAVKCAR